jgi:hypothetical protein
MKGLILRALTAASLAAAVASPVRGQLPPIVTRDTVVVIPGKDFAKGGLYASLFGTNYRGEWTTRIRVPVLDIDRFAGGLTAYKVGGGKQTKSLRLIAPDSTEYVFRPVYKAGTNLPEMYRGTVVWSIVRDEGSGSHPAATVAPAAIMSAAGVTHPTAVLVVMPDDPRLGEHRSEFAGLLGTIEEYPARKATGVMPPDALDVIDSDVLLQNINRSPANRVDAHAMLTAVMIDMLIGDNDRHPDQFKWARVTNGPDSIWEPIPRDRDKAFVSYEGSLIALTRKLMPSLVQFREQYPDISALFQNATDFDRRVLAPLDKSAWDSTARWIQSRVTNDVIDRAMAAMPHEYAASARRIGEILRARRDNLPEAAASYYDELYRAADIHGTDAAERATLNRAADGSVTLTMQDANGSTWYNRRFVPAETREIRLYLHGGDDAATITGTATPGIKIRVIGGNGNNSLTDQTRTARLYDEGMTSGVYYAEDTLKPNFDEATEFNKVFNRRPWVHGFGTLMPPEKDNGVSWKPVVGLKTGHGLGLVPKIGIARVGYGWRRVPYSSLMQLDAAYSTGTSGWKSVLIADKRFISSDFHLPFAAMMSQIEVIQFRGFGNDIEESDSKFFDVSQRMWQARPAIGFSFHPGSDISLGPIVRYTTTDSISNRFISQNRPFGFPDFKQAGVQAALHFESRIEPDTMKPRFVADLTGSGFPAVWDVNSAYEAVEGTVASYITVPLPKKPVIALRAGGKKLFGDFPYFDAAFLGGGNSFRIEHRQRYAGDASAFGSAEVRYPIAEFPFILPLNIGAMAFGDAGRVYVDGESPGGWHTAAGGGFWVGAINPGMNLNVLYTNRSNRRVLVSLGFAY